MKPVVNVHSLGHSPIFVLTWPHRTQLPYNLTFDSSAQLHCLRPPWDHSFYCDAAPGPPQVGPGQRQLEMFRAGVSAAWWWDKGPTPEWAIKKLEKTRPGLQLVSLFVPRGLQHPNQVEDPSG